MVPSDSPGPDGIDRVEFQVRTNPGTQPGPLMKVASGGNGAASHVSGEIIDRLNKEINAGLADPNMKARLANMGGVVLAGSAADFGVDETEKWGKVVKFAGVKPERWRPIFQGGTQFEAADGPAESIVQSSTRHGL
jgi:hypothetical protein